MATSTSKLEMVLQARDEASAKIKEVERATQNLGDKVRDLRGVFGTAIGALSVYAGTKGLGMLIKAYEDSQMQIAQARFFLAGYGKDVQKNLGILQQWARGVQQQIGASDEYATLVAAKLLPRIKNLSKAQAFGLTLLRGQRLGLFNASEAANMLIRATEGNERAMRFLVEQLGIAAPEFVSLQTLFEELARRIEEAEMSLSPFTIQFNILKEQLGDFGERAGLPLVHWLSVILTWVNKMIERFPILGTIISGAMLLISAALAAAGMAFALRATGIIAALTSIGLAIAPFFANPITLAILAIVGSLAVLIARWEDTKALLILIWQGLAIIGNAIWTFIKDTIVANVVAAAQILKENWVEFLTFWGNLWEAIKSVMSAVVDWILEKVNAIIGAVQSAISALARIGSSIGASISGAARTVGGFLTGRQHGGAVTAGRPYLVGERGAEMFVPRTSGTIIPNVGGSILVDMRGSVFLDERVAVEIGDLIVNRLQKLHRIGL